MESFIFDDLFGINQIFVQKFYSERLHFAVKNGDLDQVEELLDEPGADLNTCYYGENLLWTAIMNNQEELAIFLIHNGIDTSFKCCRIDLKEDELASDKEPDRKCQVKLNSNSIGSGKRSVDSKSSSDNEADVTAFADVFVVTCRQLAYEKEMFDIVNLIDFKQGCLLRWYKPPSHMVRLCKSAKLAESRSLRELALPPDRVKPKGSPRGRRYIKKKGVGGSASTPLPVEPLKTDITFNSETADLATGSQPQPPSSVGPLESVDIANDDTVSNRSKRPVQTAKYAAGCDGKPHSSVVRFTKTAVIRQREVNRASKDQQYRLRHPEHLDATLERPPSRPTNASEFEHRSTNSSRRTHTPLPARQTPQTNFSNYGNHLPFRRKAVFNGYIEQVFKRSLHCYQHSTRQINRGKFVGRM